MHAVNLRFLATPAVTATGSGQGRRASLRDVAALAGTSTAVVSYVVNGGPRPVSPATRERVEQAMATLDYRPNYLARGLRAKRTGALGLVVPDLAKPFFAELAAAVEDASLARQYRLLITSSRFDVAREQLQIRSLLDARVDGIILVPSADPRASLRTLNQARVPHLIAHRAMTGHTPSVCGDDWRAGREAAEHLLGHGHRRIACLSGPGTGSPVDNRTIGFLGALQANGIATGHQLIQRCDYTAPAKSAQSATRALLARHPDVTAICAAIEEFGPGVIRAATACGREVGNDLALIVIGGTAQGREGPSLMTAMQMPFEEIAAACLELALRDTQDPQDLHRLVQLRLAPGETCGPHPRLDADR
jgi:LacI family transcriptional regulator